MELTEPGHGTLTDKSAGQGAAKQSQFKAVAARVLERYLDAAPYFKSALRVVAAFAFLLFGSSKLVAFPTSILPSGGTAALLSELGLAALLESVGGLLLLVGLATRPVAFVLSGEMAVAYFQVHLRQGLWPTTNGGIAALLFCFLWLYFSAAGAGPWSLDALRDKSARK